MIQINGTELPVAPDAYTVGIQDISNAERNAQGEMILDRIATKRKLSLSWHILSGSDMSTILNLVSDVFFTVNYIDPQDNAARSGTFYSGDRTAAGITYKDNMMYWKDAKFDVIER